MRKAVAEIGRLRVLVNRPREGCVIIDQHRLGEPTKNGGQIALEPGELEDLVVALDAAQGAVEPSDPTDPGRLALAYHNAFRTAQQALYKIGIRYRVEVYVNSEDFFYIVPPEMQHHVKRFPNELRFDLGGVTLVCERGRRV